MMRVLPDKKMSESFNSWVKICVTCYLELFVRLLSIYFTCYICDVLINNALNSSGVQAGIIVTLFGKAFIIMGLIAFMRQAPKLISEVVGIDSSNMSLGIKDKLAAGGLFTAGAMVGTAATRIANKATGSFQKYRALDKKDKTAGKFAKSLIGGTFGAAAAGLGGAGRGFLKGRGAKSFTEMKDAAKTASAEADAKAQKRSAYIAAHGGTVGGVAKGLAIDARDSVKSWAGIDNLAGLKEQKRVYDEGMGFYKRLKGLAEGEAELQAYSGQYQALKEQIIDRNDFYTKVDPVTGEELETAVFDENAYVKALAKHRENVEAAEKRLKVATLQTIVNNRGKGNYAAIMEEFTTFKSMHADDEAINNMGTITPADLAKFNDIEYTASDGKTYIGQQILANLGDKDITRFWDDLKNGNIKNADGSTFSIASNDNTFKIKSGQTAEAISKKELESANK